jgi:hypothetical protein
LRNKVNISTAIQTPDFKLQTSDTGHQTSHFIFVSPWSFCPF